MHSPATFAEHMLGLLKTTGPSGPSGPTPVKPQNLKEISGTTREHHLGPVDSEWSQPITATGTKKTKINQCIIQPVTTGATGTTTFAEAAGDDPAAAAEWVAILAELKRSDPADWLSGDRWREVVTDAEIFLAGWGYTAARLGWQSLDLFGVHSVAPASRFDAMGLVPLIHGGSVAAMTGASATIRRVTGAVLTYRRREASNAVLISEVTA